VLAPLRLDELGASGAAIGVVFLLIAAVEAVLSPLSGRLSDRHGRLAPIRVGLIGAFVMAALLPLPETVVVLAIALGAAVAALGAFWAPAMALLSDASESAGLDQALAFGVANLAWASGHMAGSAGGAALADATADALPYAALGVACALTFGALARTGARQPAPG
jgi:MFS family permease